MAIQHAHWASQHDWFRYSKRHGQFMYAVVAYDDMIDAEVEFTDYQELRAWAGY